MRVTVNYDLCCGHALCSSIAPEIFEVRDDEKAYVIVAPHESQREVILQAIRLCPQMAIDLHET